MHEVAGYLMWIQLHKNEQQGHEGFIGIHKFHYFKCSHQLMVGEKGAPRSFVAPNLGLLQLDT